MKYIFSYVFKNYSISVNGHCKIYFIVKIKDLIMFSDSFMLIKVVFKPKGVILWYNL